MATLIVVEDNNRYRNGLVELFASRDEHRVEHAFGDGSDVIEFVERATERPCDLVLMDIAMPTIDGIEATRVLRARFPDLRIVILTLFETPARIAEAIAAGADGYLSKRCSLDELHDYVDLVMNGGAALTPDVAKTVLTLVRNLEAPSNRPVSVGLTDREREVLSGLVSGQPYKAVADDLGISIETVRTYVKRIYEKLQVHSVAEAVARALREGLV